MLGHAECAYIRTGPTRQNVMGYYHRRGSYKIGNRSDYYDVGIDELDHTAVQGAACVKVLVRWAVGKI